MVALSPHVGAVTRPPSGAPDLLTADELAALFSPLRTDYRRLAVTTAGLGYRERAGLIRQRLDTYALALREALRNGVDDAAFAVRGGRR